MSLYKDFKFSFILKSPKLLGKSLTKIPQGGLDNFWLIVRLVALLISSKKLAGPF